MYMKINISDTKENGETAKNTVGVICLHTFYWGVFFNIIFVAKVLENW